MIERGINLVVGIKYCGGCNPRYDRLDFSKKIMQDYKDQILFKTVSQDEEYDAILVICGCRSMCAEHVIYNSRYGKVFCSHISDYKRVCGELERIMEIKNGEHYGL